MGRRRKDVQPAPARLRPAERARRMSSAGKWCVVITRYDGRKRVFAEYPPTQEGRDRAARTVLQLRRVQCVAELVAKSALGWELRE